MHSEDLSIALIQTDLYWEDRVANLANLEEKIWSMEQQVDLIILPEMFPTGFSMNAEKLAEPMNLHVCKWMKQMASQTNAVLTGSAIIKENGKFFNRLLWVRPDGEISHYDKRHLFRMAKEDELYDLGQETKVFHLKGWKILPQICYDLRFPVFSRNRWENGEAFYDLVFYIASWPGVRSSAWEALLPARAIENLAYSLGVNRVGEDGNRINYLGASGAYDYNGNELVQMRGEEKIEYVHLSKAALDRFREKFPAWQDADSFSLEG